MSGGTLYLDSFAGIAGDMFTAAFLDADLVSPQQVQAVPRLLGADGVTVEISTPQKASARATQVRVVLPDGKEEGAARPSDGKEAGKHHHYHYTALVRQLEASALDPPTRAFALRVFRLLAEAEADAHGVALEEVAFHEVGAVDSVVDVAMAGTCMTTVAPDRILASPVKLGRGTIRIQHGTYPVPPPASARLATGMPIAPVPEAITRENVELSTPTGLAILRALDPEFTGEWPPGRLLAQGSGAGSMELEDYPNVFRIALLEGLSIPGRTSLPYDTDTVVELRCNVDDQTGERTAWIMERGLELGALDAWLTPVLGKKGRPASCMAFLANPEEVARLSDFLLRHSSTFGVRYSPWNRFKLLREEEVRDTADGPVRFKIGRTTEGEKVKEKPEFEDLRKIWEE